MTLSLPGQQFSFIRDMPEIVEEESHPDGLPSQPAHLKGMYLDSAELFVPYIQPHQHNNSTSTSASSSESTSSSPTTTLSIADDSSVPEMSPGSSPESPVARPQVPASLPPRHPLLDHAAATPRSSSSFELGRPITPGKRPRNLKNLAVNTSGNVGGPRQMIATNDAAEPEVIAEPKLMAPRLPDLSFRKPPTPPRRKGSKISLTIMTPATAAASNTLQANVVPPTPSLSRPGALRHFQSSPALPTINTPHIAKDAPALPLIGRPALERAQSDLLARTEDEYTNFDIPQSREEKPEAYPHGPICVFEPYIDLYLEPTAEQAATYDVILNVASEVRNPFLTYSQPDPTSSENIRMDGGGGIQYARKPSCNVAESAVSQSRLETGHLQDTSTNDTLQTQATVVKRQPEYIHIPWDHNTDIVSDLVRLVKVIDERVRQGKRILIHCQCGVSRSATLVVAYCLYIHPEYSVQQAYDIVKRRSKWIGPNMNLIMQLQEFSSQLVIRNSRRTMTHIGLRSLTPVEASGSWASWRANATGQKGEASTPKTAPLPPTSEESARSSLPHAIESGPSSAPSVPSDQAWPMSNSMSRRNPSEERNDGRALSVPDSSVLMDNAGSGARGAREARRPQSLRFDSSSIRSIPELNIPLISPRSEHFAMTSIRPSSDTSPNDVYGLMSPSTSTFSHAPLDRDALLGSLGMGSAVQNPPSARRITQNFSLPFRRSVASADTPSVLQVATGTYRSAASATQKDAPIKQTLVVPQNDFDGQLTSPRSMTFTQNPFADAETFVSPDTIDRMQDGSDPRSPAQQGMEPITRNIADAL